MRLSEVVSRTERSPRLPWVERMQQKKRPFYSARDRFRTQRRTGVINDVLVYPDGATRRLPSKLIQKSLFPNFPSAILAELHDHDFRDRTLSTHAHHERDGLRFADFVQHNCVLRGPPVLRGNEKSKGALRKLQIALLLQFFAQNWIESLLFAAHHGLIPENYAKRLRFGEIDLSRSGNRGSRESSSRQPERISVRDSFHASSRPSLLENIRNRASETVLTVVAKRNRVHSKLSAIDRTRQIRNLSKRMVQHVV